MITKMTGSRSFILPLLAAALFTADRSSAQNQSDVVVFDPEARQTFERLASSPLRRFMTFDFGREHDSRALSVVVPEDKAFILVSRLRGQLPEGYVSFVGTNRWLGEERHGDKVEVVVAPGKDQYDILRLARTDAVNFGMMTEDLIAWFAAHEDEIEVDILQASTDTIYGRVLRGPEDLDDFVDELYAFCPDIIDQGSGDKNDLRDMLAEHRMIYLWWD
jgi:hypothetical protein